MANVIVEGRIYRLHHGVDYVSSIAVFSLDFSQAETMKQPCHIKKQNQLHFRVGGFYIALGKEFT